MDNATGAVASREALELYLYLVEFMSLVTHSKPQIQLTYVEQGWDELVYIKLMGQPVKRLFQTRLLSR